MMNRNDLFGANSSRPWDLLRKTVSKRNSSDASSALFESALLRHGSRSSARASLSHASVNLMRSRVVGPKKSTKATFFAGSQSNCNSVSKETALACATSERISWSVPVFSGLCIGMMIEWTGGPSCHSLTSLPLLANWLVAKMLQCTNQPIRGNAA